MAPLPRSSSFVTVKSSRLSVKGSGGSSYIRMLLTRRFSASSASYSSEAPDSSMILAKPSWSLRSLLPASSDPTPPGDTTVSPAQLHHLLRLSALPLPRDSTEETKMISTLQSQLHFVRDVQRVDTANIVPLRSIRDETRAAMLEQTVGTAQLEHALGQEEFFGHSKRPRRRRSRPEASDAEDWNALELASQSSGKYFVVRSGRN